MIKAILFDFDGVLTTDATGSASICNYISKHTGIGFEALKSEYYKYNDDLLYGETTHAEIWQKLCDNLNYDISMDILNDSFINTPIDKQMIIFAEALKSKGYKIGMITDNKADRIDSIVKHYNWSKLFDIITVSADVGSGKDREKIFVKTITGLNLPASECVFIDNKEKNLVIPKQMGMSVIYFDHGKRDYNGFIRDLSKIGCEIGVKAMPKMTNVNAVKIYENIKANFGDAAADDFAAKFPLSKSADYLRKFKWAKAVCDYLDSTYSPEDVRKIRMACSCCPPESKMAKIKRLYDKAADLNEFVTEFNLEYKGESIIWHDGDDIYFSYPVCYCPCVKHVAETLPETWCLCTLGYAKKLFDYVLGCDTDVELLESVKLGDSRCVISITTHKKITRK